METTGQAHTPERLAQTDRFLIGIVVGIVLLVVVAFVAVLARPKPTYMADDQPGGVVQDYLLALQQKDYARAYRYISPTLKHPPASADELADQMSAGNYYFRPGDSATLSIDQVSVFGDRATVTVREREDSNTGLFGGQAYTQSWSMKLSREAGGWKLTHADAYWLDCWESDSGCQ